ncbi:hypothetical protein EXIGLDRAFT_805704 [Exidia glandulosa HHB12029]|uniref:Uncharacterized protein n=1 Tax=Exidia glandulosa HHB12029 TaxID=1314781 RepID=A0A165M8F0_EXIGL|nr:hypothetical protein EXIGLDRAFT_805704 [Exidia glandulosa HHB12029]
MALRFDSSFPPKILAPLAVVLSAIGLVGISLLLLLSMRSTAPPIDEEASGPEIEMTTITIGAVKIEYQSSLPPFRLRKYTELIFIDGEIERYPTIAEVDEPIDPEPDEEADITDGYYY